MEIETFCPVGAPVRSLVDGFDAWSRIEELDLEAAPMLDGLFAPRHLVIAVDRKDPQSGRPVTCFRVQCLQKLTHVEPRFDSPTIILSPTRRVISARLSMETRQGQYGCWLTVNLVEEGRLREEPFMVPTEKALH